MIKYIAWVSPEHSKKLLDGWEAYKASGQWDEDEEGTQSLLDHHMQGEGEYKGVTQFVFIRFLQGEAGIKMCICNPDGYVGFRDHILSIHNTEHKHGAFLDIHESFERNAGLHTDTLGQVVSSYRFSDAYGPAGMMYRPDATRDKYQGGFNPDGMCNYFGWGTDVYSLMHHDWRTEETTFKTELRDTQKTYEDEPELPKEFEKIPGEPVVSPSLTEAVETVRSWTIGESGSSGALGTTDLHNTTAPVPFEPINPDLVQWISGDVIYQALRSDDGEHQV